MCEIIPDKSKTPWIIAKVLCNVISWPQHFYSVYYLLCYRVWVFPLAYLFADFASVYFQFPLASFKLFGKSYRTIWNQFLLHFKPIFQILKKKWGAKCLSLLPVPISITSGQLALLHRCFDGDNVCFVFFIFLIFSIDFRLFFSLIPILGGVSSVLKQPQPQQFVCFAYPFASATRNFFPTLHNRDWMLLKWKRFFLSRWVIRVSLFVALAFKRWRERWRKKRNDCRSTVLDDMMCVIVCIFL